LRCGTLAFTFVGIDTFSETIMLTLLTALALATHPPSDTTYLYRALFVRAAPGAFTQVLDEYRNRLPVYEGADGRPEIMRHRQGDHWDFMLLFPMESFETYYGEERRALRAAAAAAAGISDGEFQRTTNGLIAWREEMFVLGPSIEKVRDAFGSGTFFHVEIFIAVPGKHDELFQQREMENAYLAALERPQNMIFRRVGGAAWDLFTIGIYRDQPYFAAADLIPAERQDAAARAAGFESSSAIGPYLRTLMSRHQDTLGAIVR
jgi:hypothetical protein